MSENSLKMLESLALAGMEVPQVQEDCEVVREITELDIPTVLQELQERNWSSASAPGQATDLRILRVGHHQLAQLLAAGVSDVEAAFITGKSTQTIAKLRIDPAFKELLEHYSIEKKEHSVNIYARLTTIGALASELLQERLEETPEKFTNSELRQLLEISAPSKGNGVTSDAGRAPLNVQINFVKSDENVNARVVEGRVIEEIEDGTK